MSIDYQDYKKEKKPKKEYGYGYSSAGDCDVKNDIDNLYISKQFEKVEPFSTITNYPTAILIGIELPNTIGQLRIVSEQLIDEGYSLYIDTLKRSEKNQLKNAIKMNASFYLRCDESIKLKNLTSKEELVVKNILDLKKFIKL